MNAVFNRERSSFIWCQYEDQGHIFSWSLRFTDKKDEQIFRETFGRCAYETMNRIKFEKASKADQTYLIDAYQEDVDMEDVETNEEETEEEEQEEGDTYSVDSEEEEMKQQALGKQHKNSHLAVGYKHERSFVVRGDKIGVFKYDDRSKLKFATTINNVSTLDGKSLNPKKVGIKYYFYSSYLFLV
jgi:hypothetical protein